MKNLKTIALTLVVVFGTMTLSAQNKKIKAENSFITWVGKKITGQHNGKINFTEGTLAFTGTKLKGGAFTVDMNSIIVSDLEGKSKNNLEGHLKSDDFFGVANHSTATLVFKTIADKGSDVYNVTADLTIKQITQSVNFDMSIGDGTARAAFKIDRTKFDIKYNSGSFFDSLGDKAIYNDFDLTVSLVF